MHVYVRKSYIRVGFDVSWPTVDLVLDYKDLLIKPGSRYNVKAISRPGIVIPGIYQAKIEPLSGSELFQVRLEKALYLEFPRPIMA